MSGVLGGRYARTVRSSEVVKFGDGFVVTTGRWVRWKKERML